MWVLRHLRNALQGIVVIGQIRRTGMLLEPSHWCGDDYGNYGSVSVDVGWQ